LASASTTAKSSVTGMARSEAAAGKAGSERWERSSEFLQGDEPVGRTSRALAVLLGASPELQQLLPQVVQIPQVPAAWRHQRGGDQTELCPPGQRSWRDAKGSRCLAGAQQAFRLVDHTGGRYVADMP
jgi:hypothetical protein